jgi:hypothetical protein
MGLGRSGLGVQILSIGGFGLFYVGYDGSGASRPTDAHVTTYLFVWRIDKEGEGMGINRFSDIEERKRNETDAKAGDEVPKGKKGDASSRLQASEGPAENEEKREVVEKLENRERSS